MFTLRKESKSRTTLNLFTREGKSREAEKQDVDHISSGRVKER